MISILLSYLISSISNEYNKLGWSTCDGDVCSNELKIIINYRIPIKIDDIIHIGLIDNINRHSVCLMSRSHFYSNIN